MRGLHLYALALLAGEGGLHPAVVLAQGPGLVDELHVVAGGRGAAVGPQGLLAGGLRGPLGVVDVEDHVALAHVKVPRDDGGGVDDLDQQLEEEEEEEEEKEEEDEEGDEQADEWEEEEQEEEEEEEGEENEGRGEQGEAMIIRKIRQDLNHSSGCVTGAFKLGTIEPACDGAGAMNPISISALLLEAE